MASSHGGGVGNPVAPAIDGPASLYHILQKASEVDNFLKWVEAQHQISGVEGLLSGYKFFLGSIMKCFLNEIYMNSALELTTDDILFRAQFKGILLRDTPNTCDETILFKRIWTHGKAVSKAKSWLELKEATDRMKADLDAFTDLVENHCSPTVPFPKNFVLQALAADHVFTFLNDTSHNLPLAELVFPSIEHTATEKSLFEAFPGYVYALQFLWYSLLGREEFERTAVRELHLALDEEEVKKHPRTKSHFEEMLEGKEGFGFFSKAEKIDESNLSEEARDFIESARRDNPARSERWAALDRFYRPIQNEIVNPRQARLQVALGMSHILGLQGYSKDVLKDLLDPSRVDEPHYLTGGDSDSRKKQLALALRWYDVNVLDTQTLRVFNGVPAFASTLLGSVELAKVFRRDEQVRAIVFKHPIGWENHYDYSFGVLIQAYGSEGLSDYSGWLIFFECATDHSGFGGSLLDFANSVVEVAQKRGPISLSEIVVDRDLFKEYLREHSVSSVFDTLIKQTAGGSKEIGSLTAILAELNDFLAHSKGKLLEHVVHKWIDATQGFDNTACDTWVNDEQIDCTGEIGGSLSIFECKLNLHQDTIDNTLSQVRRKVSALRSDNQKIEARLVVYGPVPADTKKAFEQEGISVTDNFRNIVAENRCFNGTRKETLEVLDWQFRTPGKLRPEF